MRFSQDYQRQGQCELSAAAKLKIPLHSVGLEELANDPEEINQSDLQLLDPNQCSCLLPQALWS